VSFDFAVFDPAVAPRDGKGFRAWYDQQVDWDIDAPDPEPSILAQPLRQWYEAMTVQYPDKIWSGADGDAAIDYCFTQHFIYCSMSPNRGADAWKLAQKLAVDLGIGTYDPMSDNERDNSCIVFPDGPFPNPPSWLSRVFGKATG
jgi:hypothetical protein